VLKQDFSNSANIDTGEATVQVAENRGELALQVV
jgi:hypothetical protein